MKKIINSLFLILISSNCFAFGITGHRITGEIATQYLSENSKKAIAEIIGNESLAEASTYVDEMKSNPLEFWQKTASPYHYVTVPKGKKYNDVKAPATGDSVTALEMYSKVLKSSTESKKNKTLALKFIVHLIGDLHQPLHSGNGTDRGGNDFKVKFFWQDSNLHRVWDSGLIDKQKLSYTEWVQHLNRQITEDNIKLWGSIEPITWIAESIVIRDRIYPVVSHLQGAENDIPEISWDYNYAHLPTLKTRLKQGGVRIALYLNNIFQ